MAEVDRDAQELLEASVVLPQEVIVGGHGEPFWVSFFNTQARTLHLGNRDGEYLLNERNADLAVGYREKNPCSVSAGEDEI